MLHWSCHTYGQCLTPLFASLSVRCLTALVPQNEPGGYKALVFDQGDRIGQSVSAADVADICLRALHEPEARNKTFDVCYEFQKDEGLQLYELVASIPSKGGNYLAEALSTLARNT